MEIAVCARLALGATSAQTACVTAKLDQSAQLELPDPFAREVGDVADLLERVAAVLGDIERAGVRELPRLEVGEVELDRSGARIDVEIEVVLARHPRARPRLALALGARAR